MQRDAYELSISREVDATPRRLFRAWTDPEWLVQWFSPAPWTTASAILDPRPGGRMDITMQSPDGDRHLNSGIFLDLVPHSLIIFTNVYRAGWIPASPELRMTGIITFEDLDAGRARYTASVRHWSAKDRERHEAMGFHQGWNVALDQLLELEKNQPPD